MRPGLGPNPFHGPGHSHRPNPYQGSLARSAELVARGKGRDLTKPRQDETGQDKTGQYNTIQDKTRQDKTRQDTVGVGEEDTR
jgi:hypothetical protein